VFGVEAVGLALCIPLLPGINVTAFAKEVATSSAVTGARVAHRSPMMGP
jgi:hypothetical protein